MTIAAMDDPPHSAQTYYLRVLDNRLEPRYLIDEWVIVLPAPPMAEHADALIWRDAENYVIIPARQLSPSHRQVAHTIIGRLESLAADM